jgi:hypothetical protein
MAEPHGGPRPPDRKPRPPAGPGRFANRQDMSRVTPGQIPGQPAFAPTGLPYGDAQRLMQAQQQVAIPASRQGPAPSPSPVSGGGAPMRAPSPQRPQPGAPNLADLLSRPTLRPNEPVTTGLPVGPGAGPEAFAEPVPEEAGGLRRMMASASSPGMPPDVRGMGMLFSLVDRLRKNYSRPVPTVTADELMEPFPSGVPSFAGMPTAPPTPVLAPMPPGAPPNGI